MEMKEKASLEEAGTAPIDESTLKKYLLMKKKYVSY
jgi:hypothetical protein